MKKNRALNQEKREAILQSAIKEFFEKGYEGSSMDTISKEANVSKATVYNHFKSKEELFLALADILKSRFEDSFKFAYSKDISIEKQLFHIAKKELDFLNSEENIKLIQIMTIVMIQKNEIGLKLLEIAKDDTLNMTQKWFDYAKEDGKLYFEDSSFVSKQFIGMIKTFAFYPQLYGAPRLTKEEENSLVDRSINMIMKLYGINK